MSTRSLRRVCTLLSFAFMIVTAFASAQQVRQGIYRGTPVTYVAKNGKAMFQGDIVLEKVQTIDPQVAPPSFGIDYAQYLWPKVGAQYQIPYVIASGSGDTANLNAAISQFNSTLSNIQFVAYTSQTDYVNFYFNPGDFSGECEAIVGRAGGEQNVGGSAQCTVATILHEMGHTVGLWHEQSRPDRNTYISVNYNNLIKGSISNFNQIYDNAQTFGTLFDYASIMEYPAFSFSRNGGPAIESIPAGIPLSNSTGYSATDIDGIERLYGNAATAVTVTSNPPGLQVIVDGATLTTPQVFTNWALILHAYARYSFGRAEPVRKHRQQHAANDLLLRIWSLERFEFGQPHDHGTSGKRRAGDARDFAGGDHLFGKLCSAGSLRGNDLSGRDGNGNTDARAAKLLRIVAGLLYGAAAGHTDCDSELRAEFL